MAANENVSRGQFGQQSMGLSGGRAKGRQTVAPEAPIPSGRDAEGQLHGQLKMFMTPAEIHAGHTPLFGDREAVYVEGKHDADYADAALADGADDFGLEQSDFRTGGQGLRTGRLAAAMDRRVAAGGQTWGMLGVETDDQLWARKLDETQISRRERRDELGVGTRTPDFMENMSDPPRESQYSGGTDTREDAAWESRARRAQDAEDEWDRPHYDRIAQHGVETPVRLGTRTDEDPLGSGKPMIYGGHHRIAAATDIDRSRQHWAEMYNARHPDSPKRKVETYLPVLHEHDWGSMKSPKIAGARTYDRRRGEWTVTKGAYPYD